MKFSDANKKEAKENISLTRKNLKQEETSLHSLSVYQNVGVYLMKPGMRGDFKDLSKLGNNGHEALSWAVRVFYTNGFWNVQLAPHSEVDKENIPVELTMIEKFFRKNNDVECFANLHFIKFKTKKQKLAESIVNFLLGVLQEYKIDGIEKQEIFKKHSKPEINERYTIYYNLEQKNSIDSIVVKKHSALIRALKDHITDNEELNYLNQLNEKQFEDHDLIKIQDLSKKYLSQSERIKIAMKFLEK